MPRFVVLHHDCPGDRPRPSHWDLMLEADGVLRTWALARMPDAVTEQFVERLPDHRLAYLDYEGPVSGNRGAVTRWDSGEFRWLADSPLHVEVELAGERLHGVVTLACESTEDQRWRFSFASASR